MRFPLPPPTVAPSDPFGLAPPQPAAVEHEADRQGNGRHLDSAPVRPKEELIGVLRRLVAGMARPAEQTRLMLLVADEHARLARAESVALLTPLQDADDLLRVRVGTGPLAEHEGALLPIDASFTGATLLERAPIATRDLRSHPRSYPRVEGNLGPGPACAVPLVSGDEAVGSVLLVRPPGAAPFEPAELDLLGFAAEAAAAALLAASRFQTVRGGREEVESWRRLRRAEGWTETYEAAAAAEHRVMLRCNLASGAWQWGGTLPAVLGFDADDFGATLEQWLAHVNEADREPLRQALRHTLRDGVAVAVHCLLNHRSGASRRVELRLLPARKPGEPQRIGFLEDITEQDHRAADRDRRVRAAALAEVVHRVRHEINNPLAAVLGQLQLLERERLVAAEPALRDAVRNALHESVRIRELVMRLSALEAAPTAGDAPDPPPRTRGR